MNGNINNSLRLRQVTLQDKIKQLLKKPYKLVLIQQQELEMLRNNNKRSNHAKYIEELYKHYIIECKQKTYLHK